MELTAKMTTEQCVKANRLADLGSRRRAKRYLRDHGVPGTGPALDEAIARAAAAGETPAAKGEERVARRRAEAADREAGLRARALELARAGGLVECCELLGDLSGREHYESERQFEAVCNWERATAADAAARLDADELREALALARDDAEALEELLAHVGSAWADACMDSALAEIEHLAVDDGRWSVCTYWRGSMAHRDSIRFEERDTALDYMALTYSAGDATCAVGRELVDREERG